MSDVYSVGVQSFLNAHPNVAYFHAAGNSGLTSFQGDYTPSTNPHTIGGHQYQSVEDFGTSVGKSSDTENTFTLPAGASAVVELQWKDNWSNPSESYALYLLDKTDKVLAHAMSHQHPFRVLQYTNKGASAKTVSLVIGCHSAPCDQPFVARDYAQSRSPFRYNKPAGSIDVIGAINGVYDIGAVNAAAPNSIEPYSSRGPAVSDGSIQPAFVAPDFITFAGVGNFNDPQFCGTSAAAPQAAGVLALLESSPLPGGVQALIDGAVDLGDPGQDNTYGYGRIDAKAAEASLDTPPTVNAAAGFSVTAGQSHHGHFNGALSETAKQAGLALRYVMVKKPTHGSIDLDSSSGAYTYTASSGYSGSDQFTYASSDGLTQSKKRAATATVEPASTTTPTPDLGSDSGGGGGAFALLTLLGMLGHLCRRRGARCA